VADGAGDCVAGVSAFTPPVYPAVANYERNA
jgi:hypothetical protein